MSYTKTIVSIALFAAITCALTIFPSFPMPTGGYIHLGDAVIILSVFFLGKFSPVSAGIGSALADLILGYVMYVPATLIIKAAMALTAYGIYSLRRTNFTFVLGAVACEAVMSAGYFLYDSILFGIAVAAPSALLGLTQFAGGAIIGIALYFLLKDSGLKNLLHVTDKCDK